MGVIWLGGMHVRTSTLLMAGLLIGAGVARRRPVQGVLTAMSWLIGYEALWQLTANWMLNRPIGWAVGESFAVMVAVYVLADAKLEWRWVGVAAAFFVAWMLIGFHYNVPETQRFDWPSEVLNQLSKMAWGLAFLWPIVRRAAPAQSAIGAQMVASSAGTIHSGIAGRS